MAGDGALFTREDAVEAAWAVVDPVLENHHRALPYRRHSWGPKEADLLIASARRLAQSEAHGDDSMTQPAPVVFLLDVDNTLLDNDRVVADLKRHLTQAFGAECQERYWTIFEERRTQLGYTDYLGALQRYRDENPRDPHFLRVSSYLVDYPFANRLYPGSLDVIEHLSAWGPTVILSDGDVIFQPRKVERSGLAEAVEDRVLIYIHKEQHWMTSRDVSRPAAMCWWTISSAS